MIDYGKNLKRYRENKGIMLKTVALNTGIIPNYLSQMENGHRNVSMEKAIEVLQKGFGESKTEAIKIIDRWLIEDIKTRGNVTIDNFQSIGSVNGGGVSQTGDVNIEKEDNIEKIVKLKQAGFTLDEIKDILSI